MYGIENGTVELLTCLRVCAERTMQHSVLSQCSNRDAGECKLRLLVTGSATDGHSFLI